MARTEKGSRLRGLPPIIRLQLLEAATGSFPPVSRTSLDNRTGRNLTAFDDTQMLRYGFYEYISASNSGGLELGSGLPSGSQYIFSEIKTNMLASGYLRAGIGDKWVTRTPGQSIMPFDDSNHPAMDGMIMASQTQSNGSFYATGSALADTGPGFQQPLWDKTKIEINITSSTAHSVSLTNFTSGSNSYQMAYFNKGLGKWVGVGSGREPINYIGGNPGIAGATSVSPLLQFLEEKAVGFGGVLGQSSVNANLVSASFVYGNPIDNFGFPYHPKYSGSSGTTFSMKDYISEPFLLEKVVVYFSGTFSLGNSNTLFVSSSYKSLTTFFILNETNIPFGYTGLTNNHILTYFSGNTVNTQYTVNSSSLITSGNIPYKVRDLVTWLSFVGSNFDTSFLEFDTNYAKNREKSYTGTTWNGQFIMSGTVKNPIEYIGLDVPLTIGYPNNGSDSSLYAAAYREQWSYSGRSGAEKNFVSKRDWKNVIETPPFYQNISNFSIRGGGGQSYSIRVNRTYSKNNAYILMPTDNLIFGWHMSGPEYVGYNFYLGEPVINGIGPTLYFGPAGVNKVVLYGSLLRINKNGDLEEYHDTLNQLLTSNTIHEVIG